MPEVLKTFRALSSQRGGLRARRGVDMLLEETVGRSDVLAGCGKGPLRSALTLPAEWVGRIR